VPLQILTLESLPTIFWSHYVAAARVRRRIPRASSRAGAPAIRLPATQQTMRCRPWSRWQPRLLRRGVPVLRHLRTITASSSSALKA
jgi:hypothetical protein